VWWADDKAHYQGTVTDYYHCTNSNSSSDSATAAGTAGSPEAPAAAAAAPAAAPAVCLTGSKRKGASIGNAVTMQVREWFGLCCWCSV
jgi:hypothetical protein